MAAAEALGEAGVVDSLDALERVVRLDDYASVRASAMTSLLGLDSTLGVRLAAEIWDELPPSARMQILSECSDPSLVARALQDDDPRVRAMAATMAR